MQFNMHHEKDDSDDLFDLKRKKKLDEYRKREYSEQKGYDYINFANLGDDTLLGESSSFSKDNSPEQRTSGLKLKMHSLPLCNANHAFGYGLTYRFPFERFLEVFGETFTFHQYIQLSMSAWGGNCFGMSAFNALCYQDKISLMNYVKKGVSLSETAFDSIQSYEGSCFCYAGKESELTAFIERLFLLQYSAEYADLHCKQGQLQETESERMQRYYNGIVYNKTPYVLLIDWIENGGRVGHAVNIESGRAPEDLGNGWKRIYICDPNYPYHDFGRNKRLPYYDRAENRYIDINVQNGQWKMEALLNSNNPKAAGVVIGSMIPESHMLMLDLTDFPYSMYRTYSLHPKWTFDRNLISYACADLTVTDLKGKVLCRLEDGQITEKNDEAIYQIPVVGMTLEGERVCNTGSLLLPQESVVISTKGGRVGFYSPESSLSFVGEKEYQVTIQEGQKAELTSGDSGMVNVVAWKGADKAFTSYMTDVKVSKYPCTIQLNAHSLGIETTDVQLLDVDIITEEGSFSKKQIPAFGGSIVKAVEAMKTSEKQRHLHSK